MLSHTKIKKGNPVTQNQLNDSGLTHPSQVFEDGIIALSPIPHPFFSHMLFP